MSLKIRLLYPTSEDVLKTSTDEIARQFREYEILRSIPGVGCKITATINRITKRGSTKLRQALYTAVQCGLTNNRNTKLKEFYDKKRSEGKPHKVAIIACANKLLHWIYAILKHDEIFKA